MKMGFIGLGQMGAGMATNLLKAGHEIAVYNRSRTKTEALVQLGARAHHTVSAVCKEDVVVTMLADDNAVESVVFDDDGVLASLRRGAVHISSSTISVALSERIAAAHMAAGQYYLAAPVFGRPDAAASGKLFVVVGGAPDVVNFCTPFFEAIGQKTFVMSERPEAANLVKLSGNFLIDSVIESLGEAISLISKGGLDPQRYVDLLTTALFNVPIYKTYGRKVIERQFEAAGFAQLMAQTHIRLTLAAADNLRVPLPIANIIRDRSLI